jgi:signal peptidase
VLAIPGVGALVSGTQNVLSTTQRRLASLLGTRSLLGTQGLAYLLMVASIVLYVADVIRESGRKDRSRERSRTTGKSGRALLVVFAGAVVLAATAAMVIPAGPQEFGVVSAETDSPGLGVIETGTSESAQYVLGNGGLVPMVTYLEPTTDGADVQPREVVVPGQSTANATLTLTAPPETGYYRQYVVEHRYLYVLPKPVIGTLHEAHPWAPVVVIDALIGLVFYALGAAFLGTGRVRPRERDGPSWLDRIRSRVPLLTGQRTSGGDRR